jgi:hypothetical protein
MTGPERRQYPRTTLETFAYINLGAGNYGSVLNVSETGLSFRSVAPIVRNRPIRFWFSEHNHRIEAAGEVVWTDDTQKGGGLRFTTLSPQAHAQIRHWIRQAAPVMGPDPVTLTGPIVTSGFLSTGHTQPTAVPGISAPGSVPSKQLKVKVHLSGFTGGLAIGLMIAALVAAGFVFQNYRRQFGESLIRIGERFAAAKPQVQEQPPEPAPAAAAPPTHDVLASPDPQPTPTVSPAPRTAPPVPVPALVATAVDRPATPTSKLSSASPQPQPAKLEAAALTMPASAKTMPVPVTAIDSAPKNLASSSNLPVTAPPPAIPLPKGARVVLIPGKVEVAPPAPPPAPPAAHTQTAGALTEVSSGSDKIGPPPDMFFEVGKFKDESSADKQTNELSQLGFPASVRQKSRLWSNSYLVLVGPFNDEQKAAAVNQNLLAHDLRPRPFERGSRDILLRSGLTLNGARMPEGECTVRWESYINDTVIKIVQDRLLVTTASGKWVKNDAKYKRDAFVVRRNPDGTRTLLEIQFGGLSKTLVFGKPS